MYKVTVQQMTRHGCFKNWFTGKREILLKIYYSQFLRRENYLDKSCARVNPPSDTVTHVVNDNSAFVFYVQLGKQRLEHARHHDSVERIAAG